MKVNVYGNVLNNGYNITTFLRNKGIDATLFLDNSSPLQQDYPWWEDSSLSKTTLPDWIKYYDVKPFFLFPNAETKRMINDFKYCDVALVNCWGPILALKAKVKFLFFSIGGDLNCINLREDLKSLIYATMPFKSRVRKLIKMISYSPLQKKALKEKANRIFVLMGYQELPYIKKYGLWPKTLRCRLLWDIEKYRPNTDKVLEEKYKNYDLVFFMPARHSWYSLWNDCKGNNKFLKSYAKFVKKYHPNAILICAEKGLDTQRSKNLIKSLGIKENVTWVKELNKDGIRSYESLENVVVIDQFGHERWLERYPAENNKVRIGFGLASIEALSAGRVLITAFSDEQYYEGNLPPILNAFTEEEIYSRLEQVFEMTKKERKAMGYKGYEFVKKWHGLQNVDLYIDELKKIARS